MNRATSSLLPASSLTRVVIDLDNTLIDYDRMFFEVAKERGWISSDVRTDKNSVKLAVYARADRDEADRRWLAVQHECYGERILGASIDSEALLALQEMQARGWMPILVSHKSSLSQLDRRTDLRSPALGLLERRGIFDLLSREQAIFAETAAEKIAVISELSPLLIVDDLKSVLDDPALAPFNKLWFSRESDPALVNMPSWSGVRAFSRMLAETSAGGFHFTKLATKSGGSSRNQIVAITTASGQERIAKIFPESEEGRASAAREHAIAVELELESSGVVDVARPLHIHANVTMHERLQDASALTDEECYECLHRFLVRARDLRSPVEVVDDAGDRRSFLDHLHGHLDRLDLPHRMRASIADLLSGIQRDDALDFAQGERRFVFADFSPGSVVRSRSRQVFLDLEDAGMGDRERFLCNLVLHPRARIRPDVFARIARALDADPERFRRVFVASYAQWILIILNDFATTGERSEERLAHARVRLDFALGAFAALPRGQRARSFFSARADRLWADATATKWWHDERMWLDAEGARA